MHVHTVNVCDTLVMSMSTEMCICKLIYTLTGTKLRKYSKARDTAQLLEVMAKIVTTTQGNKALPECILTKVHVARVRSLENIEYRIQNDN